MAVRLRGSIRLTLALVVVGALAGVAASIAHALAFDDASPCPVTIENGAPLLVCPGGTVGSPYSLKVVARGGCDPEFSFSVINGALPSGLSMASNGQISGTPTTSGTYRFWARVHDIGPSEGGPAWCSNPNNAEREFQIAIDPGLVITTNSVPQTASVGVPYSATLQAQLVTSLSPPAGSTPGNLTWTVLNFGTGLPPGLTLGAGTITGTPTTEGSYTFRIQASANGASHFQTYSLTVRQPLKLTPAKPLNTPPLPTLWEVGVPFSAKLTATGGNGTFTIALADGTLPTGLAVAADGTIAGTPRAAGLTRATIRVTDGEGRTADYVAAFGVANKLVVSTRSAKPGRVGKLYRLKLQTTGGLPPKTWKVASGPLPKGLRLDRTLGVVSGVPLKAGSYTVTFEVKDGLKVAATKTLRIVVLKKK